MIKFIVAKDDSYIKKFIETKNVNLVKEHFNVHPTKIEACVSKFLNDLKESDMKNFIKYMNEYYEFMKNFNSTTKATGLISEIEKILIEMINKRSKRKEFTVEELAEFDTIFNPTDGDLKKIK